MNKLAFFIGSLAVVLGIVAVYLFLPVILPADHQPPANAEILPVDEKGVGADFSLQQGDTTVKRSDFTGKVVVIYFGYASCPDICPTTMGIISQALRSLDTDEVTQVQPIFISVDPERDKPDALMAYAQHFHPSFIGLTAATQEDVRKVSGLYKTFFANFEVKSYMEYVIHHTSRAYVIDKTHNEVIILPHDMTRQDLVDGIRWGLSS